MKEDDKKEVKITKFDKIWRDEITFWLKLMSQKELLVAALLSLIVAIISFGGSILIFGKLIVARTLLAFAALFVGIVIGFFFLLVGFNASDIYDGKKEDKGK